MRFLFLSILFSIATLLFPAHVVAGSDLGVNCSSTDCVIDASSPLFAESGMYPGQSVTQRVRVQNTQPVDIAVTFRAVNDPAVTAPDFPAVLDLAIREGSATGPVVVPEQTLRALFDTTAPVTLGSVPAGETRDFFWTITFQQSAGNEYQNRSTAFDLDLDFSSSLTLEPSPTSSAPVIQTSASTGTVQGASTASVCSASVPNGTPVLILTDADSSDGAVSLSWSSVSPVTGYAINFGLVSGQYLYGTTVGVQTTYTVSGLQPGGQYFFQVIPLNDCAPGARSNEVSTVGLLVTPETLTPPDGFTQEDVLGEQTTIPADVAENSADLGQVLGESAPCSVWKEYLPLILLAVLTVLIAAEQLILRQQAGSVRTIAVLLTTILTIILFEILKDCNCSIVSILSILCRWFWLVAGAWSAIVSTFTRSLLTRNA